MADRKGEGPGNEPDLVHFIRSIQRIEGDPDCFGTAQKECARLDCPWREYCLREGR